MSVWKVHAVNGRFDHVRGKREATKRARELVGAPPQATAKDMEKYWGVTFKRVSPAYARSVGL